MRIGIITIHKIYNYGSALQAYALQHYIQKNTKHDAEIIDYVFPNEYHRSKAPQKTIVKKMRSCVRVFLDYTKRRLDLKIKCFKIFQKRFLVTSERTFNSIEEIETNPPIYDIFLTGSDQVWNPKTLYNDPTFYCDFAPKEAKKISFAASISTNKIPDDFKATVKERLSRYSAIGVRETAGVKLIEELGLPNSIRIRLNCDPTLLLTATDYNKIAETSNYKTPEKYVLVYFLDYAFNPHPAIDNIVEYVNKQFNLPIVFLGSKNIIRPKGSKYAFHTGPAEFLALVKNAEYVVTSSFHGLMFSLIYRKPFTAVVPTAEDKDTRITDVLKELGLSHRAIPRNSYEKEFCLGSPYTTTIEENLDCFIQLSKDFLLNSLNSSI